MIITLSSVFLLLAFLISGCFDATSTDSIEVIRSNLQQSYDNLYPPQFNRTNLQPHHHLKRCSLESLQSAVDNFLVDKWRSLFQNLNIFMSSPCLGSDSLGNDLGTYFENIICAQIAGAHYVAVAKIWEPKLKDQPSPFLDKVPSIILNPQPVNNTSISKRIMKDKCKCPGSCHERPKALWTKGRDIITSILHNSINHHLTSIADTHTIVRQDDLASVPVDSILPLIPDVSIHYRCGDNFIGHYGFLPFSVVTSHIPSDVKYIYVLAENRSRKTTTRPHLISHCDAIFNALFRYLSQKFPSSVILIKRGDDLYVDIARLTYAKVTICSVSTFCLWPAMASNGTSYFPKTRLIVAGDTSIDLGFNWITSPKIIFGQTLEYMSSKDIVKKLSAHRETGKHQGSRNKVQNIS